MNTHEDSKYIPPYPFPPVNRWEMWKQSILQIINIDLKLIERPEIKWTIWHLIWEREPIEPTAAQ